MSLGRHIFYIAILIKGPSIYDVCKIFGFFDPFPPCHRHSHATYQYCRLLLGDPPPSADIICTCPLTVVCGYGVNCLGGKFVIVHVEHNAVMLRCLGCKTTTMSGMITTDCLIKQAHSRRTPFEQSSPVIVVDSYRRSNFILKMHVRSDFRS